MPTNKPTKTESIQIAPSRLATPEELAEETETIRRFKRFKVGHKNYAQALKHLLDMANVG